MNLRRLLCLSTTACLIGGTVLAADVAPAAASTKTCASSAAISGKTGTGYLKWYGKEAPNGAVYHGKTLIRGAHFWESHGVDLRLSFGHNTFYLSSNAVFTLVCSGVTRAQGAIMPSIAMLRGSAKVYTTSTVLGAISTEEGLYGPVAGSRAMSYQVTRTLTQKSPLTLREEGYWFDEYTNQPVGTTTARTLTTSKLNVTPYVGPRVGSCRHVRSATLVTTHSYGHGTAVYRF